jgi:hypothetical protein
MTTTSPPTYASSDFINIVGTANITQGTGTIGFVHRDPQAKVRALIPLPPCASGQTKRRCRASIPRPTRRSSPPGTGSRSNASLKVNVMTAQQSIVWDALRRCGVNDPIPGFGRLLREF